MDRGIEVTTWEPFSDEDSNTDRIKMTGECARDGLSCGVLEDHTVAVATKNGASAVGNLVGVRTLGDGVRYVFVEEDGDVVVLPFNEVTKVWVELAEVTADEIDSLYFEVQSW